MEHIIILATALPHINIGFFGAQFGTKEFGIFGFLLFGALSLVYCFFAVFFDKMPFRWMYSFGYWFGRVFFWLFLYSDVVSGGGFSILIPMVLTVMQSFSHRFFATWLLALLFVCACNKIILQEQAFYCVITLWFASYHFFGLISRKDYNA